MGRYFSYRLHPLSLAELHRVELSDDEIHKPESHSQDLKRLLEYGGFPEPFWTDRGLGDYGLWFLRDKEKREVDFLVTREGNPWFLVEVKSSSNVSISKNLYYFQEKLKAKHAFQVVFDMDYIAKDCFSYSTPVIVPAQTFLSQLV